MMHLSARLSSDKAADAMTLNDLPQGDAVHQLARLKVLALLLSTSSQHTMIFNLVCVCEYCADVVHLLLTRLPLKDAVNLSCATRTLAIKAFPAAFRSFACAACATPLFDPRSVPSSLHSAVIASHLIIAFETIRTHARRHARIGATHCGAKNHSMQLGVPLQGDFFCTSAHVGMSQDKENVQARLFPGCGLLQELLHARHRAQPAGADVS